MPGAACGPAATSSLGYTEPASERAASRPDVRTTRMRILNPSLANPDLPFALPQRTRSTLASASEDMSVSDKVDQQYDEKREQ